MLLDHVNKLYFHKMVGKKIFTLINGKALYIILRSNYFDKKLFLQRKIEVTHFSYSYYLNVKKLIWFDWDYSGFTKLYLGYS